MTRSLPTAGPLLTLRFAAAVLASFALFALPAGAVVTLDLAHATVRSSAFFEGEFVEPPAVVSDAETFPGTFQETSTATLDPALGTATQTSTVAAGVAGLTVSSTGACETQVSLTGEPDKDLQRDALAHGTIAVQFTVTENARFSLSGSVSVSPGTPIGGDGGAKQALLSLSGAPTEIGVDEQADDTIGGVTTDGATVSGVLAPGSYQAYAECDLNFAGPENTSPTRRASWQFTLTLEEEEPSEVFRWVGGSVGSFGVAANWDPEGPAKEGVPTFVLDERADTALFQSLGSVRLDLGGVAAASRRGPRGGAVSCSGPTRRIGRLVIDDAGVVEPFGGTLVLEFLSLVDRALTLREGGDLLLRDGVVCASHVEIGASGAPSSVEVTGPGGILQTTGRISVGGEGEGHIAFADRGIGISEEVLLGAGLRQGSAVVSDATWETGNVAVGFEGPATLEVSNAGLLVSEQAFVDFNLEVDEFASASVFGAGSAWRLNHLEIGGGGTVTVLLGGRIETALVDDVLDGEVVLGNASTREAFLQVGEGTVAVASDLSVGQNGRGRLEVIESAAPPLTRVDVGGRLFVGEATGVDSKGRVDLEGNPRNDEDSLSARALVIPNGPGAKGELVMSFGARMFTATTAVIGASGGKGIVEVQGDPIEADPVGVTTWRIGESLTVGHPSDPGTTGLLLVGDAVVEVGGPAAPGSVLVQPAGAIVAVGTPNRNVLRILQPAVGLVTNHGVIQGPLTIDGRYDPASTGELVRQVAGPSGGPARVAARSPAGALAAMRSPRAKKPAALFDAPIAFTGDADLGGALVLEFRNGFAPKLGDAFEVLSVGGAVNGTFGEIRTRGLATGAGFELAAVGSSFEATSLNDAIALPTLTLKAKRALKEKKQKGAKVTFKRKGDTSQPMLVSFQVGGSATSGADYEPLPATIEIPARKKSAKLLVRPLQDGLEEGDETIEIELLPTEAYSLPIVTKTSIALVDSE